MATHETHATRHIFFGKDVFIFEKELLLYEVAGEDTYGSKFESSFCDEKEGKFLLFFWPPFFLVFI
jgi:hypothetical protein